QCDLCRISVAYLADHYHIGVLTENGWQTTRESQSRFRMNLDLADAVQHVLDGILDRDDVAIRGAKKIESAVKRRRFSGSGRPRHQQHSLWQTKDTSQFGRVERGKPELIQRDDAGTRIEQADDDFLTKVCRQCGDTHIEPTVVILHQKP